MSRKRPIFYSALMLTGVNLLLRLGGTAFQVFLSGRIGAEGIGLLQLVLSVGAMAMVAGTAGIRTATMYLAAEEKGRGTENNILWILTGCILYSAVISGGIGLLLYHFAPRIADKWVGNIQALSAIRVYALFLPVCCLCGVMSGYFTGVGRIGNLAAVEVAEQVFGVLITLALLTFWAGHDAEKACLCVVLGSGLGACMTLAVLCILRLQEQTKHGERIPVARRLRQTAVPLALADDLRTGISTVENLMVPKRLALYPGAVSPLAAFGTVCGMVFPVLMFPAAFLFGLTELLVPELARCRAAGSHRRISHLVGKSLDVALLYGTLCGGILYLTALELCQRLYRSSEAGIYLRWFAPLAVMLYCDAVTDAMIKGLGQQKHSVVYNIITNTLDVILLFVLLPKYGIAGYFLSFCVTHVINFILSLSRLIRITGHRPKIGRICMTLLTAAVGVWGAGFVALPILRAIAYLLLLFSSLALVGVIRREDLRWLQGLIKGK